jgi:hypothetical protein
MFKLDEINIPQFEVLFRGKPWKFDVLMLSLAIENAGQIGETPDEAMSYAKKMTIALHFDPPLTPTEASLLTRGFMAYFAPFQDRLKNAFGPSSSSGTSTEPAGPSASAPA